LSRSLSASRRRDKLEITRDILNVSKDGIRKTHIMYQANLSFKLLEAYVNRLVEQGLLRIVENPYRTYTTTEKGIEFLKEFKDIERYMHLAVGKREVLAQMMPRV